MEPTGGENFSFGGKLGPLPVWAWAVLGVAVILAYMYFTKSGFFAAPSNTTASGAGSSDGGLVSDMAGNLGGQPLGQSNGAAGSAPTAAGWDVLSGTQGPLSRSTAPMNVVPWLGAPEGSSASPRQYGVGSIAGYSFNPSLR